MILLEQIVSLFQVGPETQKFGLSQMSPGQVPKPGIVQSPWKNLYRQISCPVFPNQNGQPVHFLDSIVRNRNASNRCAVPMQIDRPAQILSIAEDPVRRIRIIDMQAQIKIALWVEEIEIIES